MRNQTKPDLTLYFFPLVAVIVAILVIFFLVLPTISNFQSLQDQAAEVQSGVDELQKKYDTLKSLNIDELNQMADKANVALPTEKSFPGLLSGLEALAKQAGSDLNTFEAAPRLISKKIQGDKTLVTPEVQSDDEKRLGLNHLGAKVGIFSNAASLIDLTSLLVKSSRLVTLETVSFDRPEAAGANKSNVKIDLQVYFQPDEATVSAAKFDPISDEEKQLVSKVDAFNTFNLQLPDFIPSKEDPFAK